MKILALDSSTSTASIAFLDDEKILFEYHHPQPRTNSSIFFEGLQLALHQCGKPDRLAVGLGPGSYNGLRASIAAAQGIGAAADIELVGLSSVVSLETKHDCWVMGDARGGQYWLAALSSKQELLEKPFLLSHDDLLQEVKKHPHFPIISSQALPDLASLLNITIQAPNAAILAYLAKDIEPANSVEPLYLKQPHITMSRS